MRLITHCFTKLCMFVLINVLIGQRIPPLIKSELNRKHK